MALQPATEGGGMPEALEAGADKFQAETAQLAELQESRNELLGRVNTLKKDLADWRGKLDTQVRTYRSELGELRTTLNAEVEQLRTEFQDLRTTLRQQLEATAALANEEPIEGAVTSGDAAASDGGAPA